MTNHLLGIHFDDGLQMPHFLNGRLLTASDLKAEQEAMLTRLRYLGRAAGFGVVDGLVVTRTAGPNALAISGGIGVNRAGDVIRLSDKGAQISLVLAPDIQEYGEDAGRFHRCSVTPPGINSNKGAYLLTVRPISRLQGSAPVKSIRGNLATCESQWAVDGVEFLAIPLTGFTPVDDNTELNLLAHWCYGSEGLKKLPTNPFELGLKSFLNLYPGNLVGLEECDLPLAVFTWTPRGLGLLDSWAARRRIVHSYPAVSWDAFASDTRIAEAQARFLQFQEQLEQIRVTHKPASVVAAEYFSYLPPVGFLPVEMPWQIVRQAAIEVLTGFVVKVKATKMMQDFIKDKGDIRDDLEVVLDQILQEVVDQYANVVAANTLSYLTGGNGFELNTFFGERMPERYALAPRETVDFTLNRSWYDEVIDLQEGTPFDLYFVDEDLAKLWAKVRYVLLLMLDADKIRINGEKALLIARRLGLKPDELLKVLWHRGELRKEFLVTIRREALSLPFYVMFVKRVGPLRWAALQETRPEDAPERNDEMIRLDQLARYITHIARTMKIRLPEEPPTAQPIFARKVEETVEEATRAAIHVAAGTVVETATMAAIEAAAKTATELVTKAAVEKAVATLTEHLLLAVPIQGDRTATEPVITGAAPVAAPRSAASTAPTTEAASKPTSEGTSDAETPTTPAKRSRTRAKRGSAER